MEEKKLPLVSVVVPCYNHEKYVTETIESIINQTYKNIELIVIDDGSKDNSVDIIQKLADKYGFTFIHRPNKGVSATLNDGVEMSHGKYISFVASDDYWERTKIEKQVLLMENDENLVMVFTEYEQIDENGKINKNRNLTKKQKNIKYNFEHVLMYGGLPPASILMKRHDLLSIGSFKEGMKVEDLYIWLKLLEKGGYAKIISEKLVFYRIHKGNTHSDHLMLTREHFKIIQIFLDKKNKELKQRVLNEWALRNANLLAKEYKRECIFYFKYFNIKTSIDLRFYKILVKLLFIWKSK